MTLHVPRLPFSFDPLIAEAKRRARQRRLLLAAFLIVVGAAAAAFELNSSSGGSGSGVLSGRLGGEAAAGRPASTAEFREMTPFLDFPSVPGGLLAAAWVSSTHPDIGLILLYPGHLLSKVEPGTNLQSGTLKTIQPKLLPKTAKPVAAYLFRLHPNGRAAAGLLAQTLLRGPDVLKPELANFCAVGKRVAPALTAATCLQAG